MKEQVSKVQYVHEMYLNGKELIPIRRSFNCVLFFISVSNSVLAALWISVNESTGVGKLIERCLTSNPLVFSFNVTVLP